MHRAYKHKYIATWEKRNKSPTYFPQQMQKHKYTCTHAHTHPFDHREWPTEILFVNNLEESNYLGPVYSWKDKPYLCEEPVWNQTS